MKSRMPQDVNHVLVCSGEACKKDARSLRKRLAADAAVTAGGVVVLKTSCMGCCAEGPVVVVWPKGVVFRGATMADVPGIFAEAGWTIPAED